jgi:DNA repair protein RadD
MPNDDVRTAIDAFSMGEGVIINVGILTIGSDIPSINCVILARRTLSTALFFQIVGRGARLHPGKTECVVIDLCGNAMIHGIDPDNPIRQCQGDGGDDAPRIKVCPMCESACSLNSRICRTCQFEFPKEEAEEGPEIEETTDEPPKLVEFKGYETRVAAEARYLFHLGKGKPTPCVRAEYLDDGGRTIARQWLCPQHTGWAQKKAGYYWKDLGGRYPLPNTVQQWLARKDEIIGDPLKITISTAGAYPEVKRVERIPHSESVSRSARIAQA